MSVLRANRAEERKHSESQREVACFLPAREGAGQSLFRSGLPFLKRFLLGTATMVICILLSGATPFAMGNSEQAPLEQGTVEAQADAQKKTTIQDILKYPEKFSSSEVVLEGIFRGWKGTCPSSSMLTRSDWILEDETGCIFITGRMPNNVSAVKPQGEQILVTGRVLMNKKGKPIIKADQLAELLKK